MKIPPASPTTPEPLANDPWQWPEVEKDAVEPDYAFIDRLIALGGESPESPLYQYFAVLKCRKLRPMIEAGDGFSILEAVHICGNAGLKMPLWLTYAFNRKYRAVVSFKAVSWDDPAAFGQPYPKGTNKSAERKKREKAPAVWSKVSTAVKMGHKVDKALYAAIGKELQIGATLAQEYYAHAKKHYGLFDPVAAKQRDKR